MNKSFNQLFETLKQSMFLYDSTQTIEKASILKALQKQVWNNTAQLIEYHERLLFIAAHPDNEEMATLVNNEFNRIARYLKKTKTIQQEITDTALPYSIMITRFSHDLLLWMNQYSQCKVSIDSYEENATELNTLLRMTLPSVEHDQTTAGLSNDALMDALLVKSRDRFAFLLNEFAKIDHAPYIKDFLWESLKLYVRIEATDKNFSIAFNQVAQKNVFYQNEILKKIDHLSLLNQELPKPAALNNIQLLEIVAVIKKSLILTMRETDPSTYMDEKSLRYYELERGISIAIYGMQSNRQMSLQSYIGYTLFKNGFPAAYGGSWVFGPMAMFGLNIFEAFRGGESGYMMCQLLRVYKHTFNVDYFEVEPYQYGLDNPDGIKSGAFWFYYRYGFRPVDKSLAILAESESIKIKTKKGFRSSERTLLKFTESNIALNLTGMVPTRLSDITSKVTKMIAKEFKSNRGEAMARCIDEFEKKVGKKIKQQKGQESILTDVAMLAKVLETKDTNKLSALQLMLESKATNPYLYNQHLSSFLK